MTGNQPPARGTGPADKLDVNKLIQERAAAGGGDVLLPPGEYRVAQVKGGENVRLTSERPGTVTLRPAGEVTTWIRSGPTAGFSIEGLILDGQGEGGESAVRSYGIEVSSGSRGFTLKNCRVGNLPVAIETRDDVEGLTVEGVSIHDVTIGIRLNKGPSRVVIRGCEFFEWRDSAIYVLGDDQHAVNDLLIERNVIERHRRGLPQKSVRQPIRVHGKTDRPHRGVRVLQNRIIGADTNHADTRDPGTADMISLHRTSGFEVRGNELYGGGDVGITIAQGCESGTVADNRVERVDTVGLCLGSADSKDLTCRVTVENNEFIDCAMDRPDTGGGEITRAVERAKAGVLVVRAAECTIGQNAISYQEGHPSADRRGISIRQSRDIDILPQVLRNATEELYDDADQGQGRVNAKLASSRIRLR
ncbi:right-handed parallel beta-helix repeat-containing protein [Kytococcus sedentarius]|uniref:right-handed parallel beta-helix repeat-containing protein n=1 Tax=Kytococcus sedentarius TaxID=1276 RepID=UPI0038799096